MKTTQIKTNLIDANEGQIAGLPRNPRVIKDGKFKTLVESIRALPDMMSIREVIVFPVGDRFVAIGGNQRLEGCKELGWAKIPCKVLAADTPVAVLQEITIKDNSHSGENDWQLLNEEWDKTLLEGWGMEILEWEATPPEPPAPAENLKHEKQIRLKYSEAQYLLAKEQLAKVAETPELAVWILLGNK